MCLLVDAFSPIKGNVRSVRRELERKETRVPNRGETFRPTSRVDVTWLSKVGLSNLQKRNEIKLRPLCNRGELKATLCDFYPYLAVKRYMIIH